MKLNELEQYVETKKLAGLTKIAVELELDEMLTNFYVNKTKETYVFGDEEPADAIINEARLDVGFAGAKKKFKEGKVSKKSGEQLTPDTYTVVIELAH